MSRENEGTILKKTIIEKITMRCEKDTVAFTGIPRINLLNPPAPQRREKDHCSQRGCMRAWVVDRETRYQITAVCGHDSQYGKIVNIEAQSTHCRKSQNAARGIQC